MKDYRRIMRALLAAAAVNLAVMICLIPGLPERIPVHFNYHFEVDRMGSAWFLAMVPAAALLFTAGIAAEQRIRGRDDVNSKPLTIFAVGLAALLIGLGWTLYAMCGVEAQPGDTTEVPLDLVIGLGMSALFVVMGNYLPTVQPNRMFGIRMQATFASDAVWRRTHRFAGRAFVLAGLFSAALVMTGHFTGVKWLLFVGMLGGLLGTGVTVFRYARKFSES